MLNVWNAKKKKHSMTDIPLCSVFTFSNTLGCLYTLAFSTEAYVTTTTTFKGSPDD